MIRDSLRPAEHQVGAILVVEDEPLVRLTVAEELREAGMRVIEASDADEAMELLLGGASVDLVFADVVLPGSMDGLELARRLRTDFPDIKILMTSGRTPAHEAAAVSPFVPKPYDIAEVIGRIRAACDECAPE